MFAFLLLAAQTAAPVPAPTPTATVPDRKVCRSEPTTGSIMPPKRVCHLRSEWAAIDRANGRGVDTFSNRPQNNPGSGGL